MVKQLFVGFPQTEREDHLYEVLGGPLEDLSAHMGTPECVLKVGTRMKRRRQSCQNPEVKGGSLLLFAGYGDSLAVPGCCKLIVETYVHKKQWRLVIQTPMLEGFAHPVYVIYEHWKGFDHVYLGVSEYLAVAASHLFLV